MVQDREENKGSWQVFMCRVHMCQVLVPTKGTIELIILNRETSYNTQNKQNIGGETKGTGGQWGMWAPESSKWLKRRKTR